MKNNAFKKFGIPGLAVLLVIIAVVYIVVPSFVAKTIFHMYIRILCVVCALYLLDRGFQLNESKKKFLTISGTVLGIDLVVVETVRFVLSGGISSVLFLPVCLPVCGMTAIYYLIKENNRGTRAKVINFVIGIPIVLLALYFEVLSFMDM